LPYLPFLGALRRNLIIAQSDITSLEWVDSSFPDFALLNNEAFSPGSRSSAVQMSELARNIASRLRHFIGDRRRAERCQANLPVVVTLLEESHSHTVNRGQSTSGHTLDISTTGLAVVVPVIRIGDHYLAGENRTLILDVELPDGTIEVQVTPVRYERLDEEGAEHGYLIGVSIAAMSDKDRSRYDEFVTGLLQK